MLLEYAAVFKNQIYLNFKTLDQLSVQTYRIKMNYEIERSYDSKKHSSS